MKLDKSILERLIKEELSISTSGMGVTPTKRKIAINRLVGKGEPLTDEEKAEPGNSRPVVYNLP